MQQLLLRRQAPRLLVVGGRAAGLLLLLLSLLPRAAPRRLQGRASGLLQDPLFNEAHSPLATSCRGVEGLHCSSAVQCTMARHSTTQRSTAQSAAGLASDQELPQRKAVLAAREGWQPARTGGAIYH
jgi:hypothetical protein